MKHNYSDILGRIEETPTWYDENGTPRYGEFSPDQSPNIYANTVVLLRIACQDCGEQFDVEMNSGFLENIGHPHKLHYGDPPTHACAGDTMNCEDLEVLQIWDRLISSLFEEQWTRRSKFEGPID